MFETVSVVTFVSLIFVSRFSSFSQRYDISMQLFINIFIFNWCRKFVTSEMWGPGFKSIVAQRILGPVFDSKSYPKYKNE